MNPYPLVSIVIPTYTRVELLCGRAVPSCLNQTYANIEVVIVGDGSPRAYRARCRPPSFIHFAVFPHLIRGHTLSDVVAVLGSLNVIAAELDR